MIKQNNFAYRGTSLVEAVVAMLILLIGSIAMMGSINLSINNMTTAKINNQATLITEQIYEELAATDFDLIPARINNINTDYVFNYDGQNIGNLGNGSASNTTPFFRDIDVDYNQISDNAIEVIITVMWSSKEANREKTGIEADDLDYNQRFLITRKGAI